MLKKIKREERNCD